MKSLFIATAVAALIFTAPAAFADPPDQHQDKHHGAHSDNKPAAKTNTPSESMSRSSKDTRMNGAPTNTTRTNAAPDSVYQRAIQKKGLRNRETFGNNNNNNNSANRDRNNNRGSLNNNRNYRRDNNRNRSWRNNFNRRNVTASRHYRWRGRSWNWPSGYHYQRWNFGMTLPSIFWSNNYWISDYSDYGLGAPPFGTVWVRYNDDAILIDRDTGEILEVVYDQFD